MPITLINDSEITSQNCVSISSDCPEIGQLLRDTCLDVGSSKQVRVELKPYKLKSKGEIENPFAFLGEDDTVYYLVVADTTTLYQIIFRVQQLLPSTGDSSFVVSNEERFKGGNYHYL